MNCRNCNEPARGGVGGSQGYRKIAEGGVMAQTKEDLQEELNSALRRAESAEYWIERNADLLRECGESAAALPPEREVLLVSISEMNRRIAEAVERCAQIAEGCGGNEMVYSERKTREIARKIRERAK